MSDVDLVGTTDIAEMAGTQASVVSRWKKRHGDFPRAAYYVNGLPKYLRSDVEKWLAVMAEERLRRARLALAEAHANVPRAEATLVQAEEFYNRTHPRN